MTTIRMKHHSKGGSHTSARARWWSIPHWLHLVSHLPERASAKTSLVSITWRIKSFPTKDVFGHKEDRVWIEWQSCAEWHLYCRRMETAVQGMCESKKKKVELVVLQKMALNWNTIWLFGSCTTRDLTDNHTTSPSFECGAMVVWRNNKCGANAKCEGVVD